MKIISISGLDGSGKSTQVSLLKEHLEAGGKKVFYFHAVSFSIANKLKNQESGIKNQELSGSDADTGKSVTKAGWLKIFLRKVAFIVDTCRFATLRRTLERQSVDFLLTDRFFYDSLVNIAFLEGKKSPSWLEKIMPRSDMAFYLKIEPSAIMERQRVPEQGLTYLEDKKALYDNFAARWGLQIIDGNRTKGNIFAEIKNINNN